MTVTVVLDTSAIVAYTKGSVAVGELLSIIADDGDTVLIPASCLAAAGRQLGHGEEALLGVLSTAPCVALAPLTPEQAIPVGISARRAAGIDQGHAAVEAIGHSAQLATQDGAAMGRLLPAGWPIVEI
jgi:hypothetical protein